MADAEQERLRSLIGDPEKQLAQVTNDQTVDTHIARLRGHWGSDDGQVRHHLYGRVHADVNWFTGDETRAHREALRAVSRVKDTPPITETEVDAAAAAIYGEDAGRFTVSWEDATWDVKSGYRRRARVALVAAAHATPTVPAPTVPAKGEPIGWCPRCRNGIGRADGNGQYTCDHCDHVGPDPGPAAGRTNWTVDPTDAAMVGAQPGGPDHTLKETTA
jgi:hypothetical protein